MFVITADQRRSRRDVDRVPELLKTYADRPFERPFDRTAGDEVQAVTARTTLVVEVALALVETGHWSVGIGIGPIDEPLPQITRAGRGRAFEAARDAVTRAKNAPGSLAVSATPPDNGAADAEAVLTLLALLVGRRSEEGRAAVAAMSRHRTQTAAARELGITAQAMSQRLTVAAWQPDRAARATASRLLEHADRPPTVGAPGSAILAQ